MFVCQLKINDLTFFKVEGGGANCLQGGRGRGKLSSRWKGEGQTVFKVEGGGANCLQGGRGRGKLSSRWKGERANCLKVEGGGANCLQGGRGRGKLSSRWKGEGQTVFKVEGGRANCLQGGRGRGKILLRGSPLKAKWGYIIVFWLRGVGPLYTLCTNMDVISRLHIKPYLTYSSNLFAMDPALMKC